MSNGTGKILVVDDDGAVRALVARILRREGYDVVEASDAEAALAAAASDPAGIRLLLTDVVLPGVDGAELASRLCARQPDLPVVYMSGYPEDELVTRGIGTVGAAYITKPFTAEVLTLMVRGALGEHE